MKATTTSCRKLHPNNGLIMPWGWIEVIFLEPDLRSDNSGSAESTSGRLVLLRKVRIEHGDPLRAIACSCESASNLQLIRMVFRGARSNLPHKARGMRFAVNGAGQIEVCLQRRAGLLHTRKARGLATQKISRHPKEPRRRYTSTCDAHSRDARLSDHPEYVFRAPNVT